MKSSIVSKGMATVGSLAIAVTAVTSYTVFTQSSQALISNSKQQMEHTSEVIEVKSNAFMQEVVRDIKMIEQSPALENFISAKTNGDESSKEKSLRDIEKTFESLLYINPHYFQARLIGVADNGKELLRTERVNGSVRRVQSNDLQAKGNMAYFKETVQLSKGSFYYSDFNLNKEYGKISHPKTPTIRAAAPVYLDDQVFGIIILNVNANALFSTLDDLLDADFTLYMANENGDVLFGPDTSKTFGFDLGSEFTLSTLFAGAGLDVYDTATEVRNVVNDQNELAYRKKLYANTSLPQIEILVSAPVNVVLGDFYSARKRALVVIAIALVLFLIVLVYYTRDAQGRLAKITKVLTGYSINEKYGDLPVDRDDEIGEMAKAIQLMDQKVQAQFSKLSVARSRAEQADKEKEEFIATMTHEIRNPLQSMLSMVRILEQNGVSEQQKPMLSTLKFSAENLKALVSNILDYSKIKSGSIEISSTPVDVVTLCNNIVQSLKPSAQLKKIELSVAVGDSFPELIYGDETRLYQVINNLVSNAIKYTESGSVSIELTRKDETFEVAVKDTGVGVSSENIRDIFNRFYQVSEGGNNTGSAGLGLAICKHLIEQMQGELSVDSEVGKGSRFYFSLPCRVPENEKIAPTTTELVFPDVSNVLVIEDVESQKEYYRFLANKYNWKLNLYSTAEEGIASLEGLSIDMAIIDNNLGGMLGKDFIAEHLRPSGVPTVLVSGNSIPPSNRPAQVAFIRKPFDEVEISAAFYKAEVLSLMTINRLFDTYDNNVTAIENALLLFANEFQSLMGSLPSIIRSGDLKRFKDAKHRVITHVRLLNLVPLNTLFTDIEMALESSQSCPDVNVQQILGYLTACWSIFKEEAIEQARKLS